MLASDYLHKKQDLTKQISPHVTNILWLHFFGFILKSSLPMPSVFPFFSARTSECLGVRWQRQALVTGRLAVKTMKLCRAGWRCHYLLQSLPSIWEKFLKQLLPWLPSCHCDLLFLCNWNFISLLPHAQFPTAAFEEVVIIVIISNSFTSHWLFSCKAKVEIKSCPNHSSLNTNALNQVSI